MLEATDNRTISVTVSIKPNDYARFRAIAKKQKRSFSELVRTLLEEFADKEEAKNE